MNNVKTLGTLKYILGISIKYFLVSVFNVFYDTFHVTMIIKYSLLLSKY